MSTARNKRRLDRKRHLPQVNEAIAKAMADRPCGSCTACCTAMGVSEIQKPVGVVCPKLCDDGCGIYETRPDSCKEFNCLWRYGLLDDRHRPDNTGIVFDVTGQNSFGLQMLVAREAWPGGFISGLAILRRLVGEGHVIILVEDASGEKRRLIGPPAKVAYIQKNIKILALDNGRR